METLKSCVLAFLAVFFACDLWTAILRGRYARRWGVCSLCYQPLREVRRAGRGERLRALKETYLRRLVEDPQDGTDFDCAVLHAIEALERRFAREEEAP